MGPFDQVIRSELLSAQLLSHDSSSILIETGLTTPLRWFIERAEWPPYSAKQTKPDLRDTEPAKKRRKVGSDLTVSKSRTVAVDQEDEILLAKAVFDLTLPHDQSFGVTGKVPDAIPVTLQGIEQNDVGITTLTFANLRPYGELLRLEIASFDDAVFATLQTCIASRAGRDVSPASRHRCSIQVKEQSDTLVLRITCTISWLDGSSAFPAGAPTGTYKVYGDYNLYTRLFPDLARQTVDHSQPWTPQDFYENVHTPSSTDVFPLPEHLDTDLFPFQQRAVCWMLSREGHALAPSRQTFDLHEAGVDAEGKDIHHVPLQGIISRTKHDITSSPLGGILAEEMGLGKTVEVMSLIASHMRPTPLPSSIYDHRSQTDVRPSRATLIITPHSILYQWKTELSRHAPKLKVHHYTGMTANRDKAQAAMIMDDLQHEYDVVLSTYQTLAKEVHFAEDPPERDMRHCRKYERQRSPLVQVQWWRVCLDEAQMVESGVTAAARVARRLPRINSWAVTGTPVKKKIEDLYGLLVFLGVEPFASNAKLWMHMITNHRHISRRLFGTIALRHTKAQVREDIQLPVQRRIVLTLPFTAIESQHYLSLFEEMCKAVGVQQDGSPNSETWDPEGLRVKERMRSWLIRLRQTCLHPQIGGKNRRRLGRGQGPLRTVAEVLDIMIEQNDAAIKAEEKGLINALMQRAHIVGNVKEDDERSKKALDLYKNAQKRCAEIVVEARTRLAAAIANGVAIDAESESEDSASEFTPILGRVRSSLRSALELYHKCVYFVATATYQIKINEHLTQPDSDVYRQLEEQETELYERAKQIRREVLKDAAGKAERLIVKIKSLEDSTLLHKLVPIKDLHKAGGIESRRIVTSSYEVFDLINHMMPYISAWKTKIIEILIKPLVDEDDIDKEITGDEYEDSTKQQDELYVYFDALKTLQADLQRAVTGEAAPLIDHEAKMLIKSARRWLDPVVPSELKEQPHAPELLLELFEIRTAFRKRLEDAGSIRGLIADARRLTDDTLGGRAALEAEVAQQLLQGLQPVLSIYTKALAALQKDMEQLGNTQNQRLDFYRQLQELSDAVTPYKEDLDEVLDTQALQKAMNEEEACSIWLSQLRTKQRFLQHLKEESDQEDTTRICVICQCSFDNGVLTVCGHQYCKECIQHWWHEHRSCPVCKRKLALVDFHNITYKPKKVKIQEEATIDPGTEAEVEASPSKQPSIYSIADGKLMDEIRLHDLPSSYGTKIDTLSRHLYWIREHDPGAKSIVFSQYRDFLDVLSTAFSEFKIGHSRLGKPNAVERFRKDPSIDCLLLDAKTDSSGLTLVNATHVFICEPLVQTAVELQAIARVHRIGQTRPTTVWMYLINDTVEESIYEISVTRRMEHVRARQMTSRAFEKSRSTTPAPFGEQAIDAANSVELQAPLAKLLNAGKGGGELVEDSDLWQCLFGRAQKVMPAIDEGLQAAFDRNLRAQAAQTRAMLSS